MADDERLKKKVSWCFEKARGAKQGEKHKGVLKIEPDIEESDKHIGKALHNLKAMEDFKLHYPDWSVSAAFYAMYHATLSVLYALGYESMNQECSITLLEYSSAKGTIQLEREYIDMIRSSPERIAGKYDEPGAKFLREDCQYGTETEVRVALLEMTHNNAYRFVERMRIIQEQLKQKIKR